MMSSLFPRCESAPLLEQELPDFAEHRPRPCGRRAKRPCKNQPHRFSVDAKASGDSWISNVNCIAILLRKTVLHVPEHMTWRKPVFPSRIRFSSAARISSFCQGVNPEGPKKTAQHALSSSAASICSCQESPGSRHHWSRNALNPLSSLSLVAIISTCSLSLL